MQILVGKTLLDASDWQPSPGGLFLPAPSEPLIVVAKGLILPPASLLVLPTPAQTYGVSKLKAAFEAFVRSEAVPKVMEQTLLGYPIKWLDPDSDFQECLAMVGNLCAALGEPMSKAMWLAHCAAQRTRKPYLHKPRSLVGWLTPENQ